MTIFVLRKSTNASNLFFVLSPVLFTIILIFNMSNYFGHIANNFLLWIPYLLAPLGMLLSSLYIHLGSEFYRPKILKLFFTLYILVSLLFSIYPNPFQFGELTGLQQGLMHLLLIMPFSISILIFLKIAAEAPEAKWKIYLLDSGLIVVTIGSILRGITYILNNQDSTLGMELLTLGSMLALMAFANVKKSNSVY